MKDRYRLILSDLLGGMADRRLDARRFSIDAYADFIDGVGRHAHLDSRRRGHSLGGAVPGLTSRDDRPEAVSQLIWSSAAVCRAEARAASCRSARSQRVVGDIGFYVQPDAWCGARCSRSMPIPAW